jgi:hypothetical protein
MGLEQLKKLVADYGLILFRTRDRLVAWDSGKTVYWAQNENKTQDQKG